MKFSTNYHYEIMESIGTVTKISALERSRALFRGSLLSARGKKGSMRFPHEKKKKKLQAFMQSIHTSPKILLCDLKLRLKFDNQK